jgi:HK97 gp10 family phage protein
MATNQSVERFRRLTVELMGECLLEAKGEVANQAAQLVQVMKAACPVNADPPPQPGLLRDSIGWTFGTPPATRATGAFRVKVKAGKSDFAATVYAGNNQAFYARWIEFGTQAHSLGTGADISRGKRQQGVRQHPGSPAQPFFWPSYRLMKKSMRRAVKRRLTKAIKRRSAA